MATPIKFHLDQHVSNAVAYGRRQLGIDVTTTYEVGLQDADDPDHLTYATADDRVIVTHDSVSYEGTQPAKAMPGLDTHRKRNIEVIPAG